MKFVRPCDSLEDILCVSSEKAKGLIDLYQKQGNGFLVPNFFVVPIGFFYDYVDKYNLGKYVNDFSHFSSRFSNYASTATGLPNEIVEIFEGFYDEYSDLFDFELREMSNLVVARSASVLETENNGFDGVFGSFNFNYDSIKKNIAAVFASAWTDFAHFYMRRKGMLNHGMEIIVQDEVCGSREMWGVLNFNKDGWNVTASQKLGEVCFDGSDLDFPDDEVERLQREISKYNPFAEGNAADDLIKKRDEFMLKSAIKKNIEKIISSLDMDSSKNYSYEFLTSENDVYLLQKRVSKRSDQREFFYFDEVGEYKVFTSDIICHNIVDGLVGRVYNSCDGFDFEEMNSLDGDVIVVLDKNLGGDLIKFAYGDNNEALLKNILMNVKNCRGVVYGRCDKNWVHGYEMTNALGVEIILGEDYQLKYLPTGKKVQVDYCNGVGRIVLLD